MRIVIAPDSFKGSATAIDAAASIRTGWVEVRPQDDVVLAPMADGGEGTAAVLAAADPAATWHNVATQRRGSGGSNGRWLLLGDGTAVVELAEFCGLPMLPRPDPLSASTYHLGEALLCATLHPDVRRVTITLGGSASTDGGTGVLSALGAKFLDAHGLRLRPGGAALTELAGVDLSGLSLPPQGGVICWVDVTSPLLGPSGAAHVFGPQKGATSEDIAVLEQGLRALATVLGGWAQQPGSGAAGGTAFGLATAWGANLESGAVGVAEAIGLRRLLAGANLVVTGEGSFDAQSSRGKAAGLVLAMAAGSGVPTAVVSGQSTASMPAGTIGIELVRLAGGLANAMAEPLHWLRAAGSMLAQRQPLPRKLGIK